MALAFCVQIPSECLQLTHFSVHKGDQLIVVPQTMPSSLSTGSDHHQHEVKDNHQHHHLHHHHYKSAANGAWNFGISALPLPSDRLTCWAAQLHSIDLIHAGLKFLCCLNLVFGPAGLVTSMRSCLSVISNLIFACLSRVPLFLFGHCNLLFCCFAGIIGDVSAVVNTKHLDEHTSFSGLRAFFDVWQGQVSTSSVQCGQKTANNLGNLRLAMNHTVWFRFDPFERTLLMMNGTAAEYYRVKVQVQASDSCGKNKATGTDANIRGDSFSSEASTDSDHDEPIKHKGSPASNMYVWLGLRDACQVTLRPLTTMEEMILSRIA